MTGAGNVIADPILTDDGRPAAENQFDAGGVISFLAAGAVLFASLVLGSSVSLLFAGSNALIGSILSGFLSVGLWAFGGFAVAVSLAFAVTLALRQGRTG